MFTRAALCIFLYFFASGVSFCTGLDDTYIRTTGASVATNLLNLLVGQGNFGKSYALVIGVGKSISISPTRRASFGRNAYARFFTG